MCSAARSDRRCATLRFTRCPLRVHDPAARGRVESRSTAPRETTPRSAGARRSFTVTFTPLIPAPGYPAAMDTSCIGVLVGRCALCISFALLVGRAAGDVVDAALLVHGDGRRPARSGQPWHARAKRSAWQEPQPAKTRHVHFLQDASGAAGTLPVCGVDGPVAGGFNACGSRLRFTPPRAQRRFMAGRRAVRGRAPRPMPARGCRAPRTRRCPARRPARRAGRAGGGGRGRPQRGIRGRPRRHRRGCQLEPAGADWASGKLETLGIGHGMSGSSAMT